MVSIIKQFNLIVEDLLVQTAPLVGTKYLSQYRTIVRINVSFPIDKFILSILPYKNQIIEKDIDYFINQDLDSYNEKNEILNLRDIFLKSDDNSKDNIWDILHALIILSEDRLKLK